MQLKLTTQVKNKHGVTLIELMLAVAISAILLLGVGTLYGNSKRTYTVDEEFARLQENARIAMRYLVEDIRMAGYMGCSLNNGDPNKFRCALNTGSYICNGATVASLVTGIDGYDATNSTPTDTVNLSAPTAGWINSIAATPPTQLTLAQTPNAGSDIIIVLRGNDSGVKINADKANANISIPDQGQAVAANAGISPPDCHSSSNICEGDILLLSDCQKTMVFQASDLLNDAPNSSILITHNTTSGTPGNQSVFATWGGPGEIYKGNTFKFADAELMRLRTVAYFISNNANGAPALFRHNGIGGSPAEELVESIENLQVLYGIDTDAAPDANGIFISDGIANRYESANTVNFTNPATPIVSIRISMLVRSGADIPNHPVSIGPNNLAGTSIANISDQRLRKTFTTTIKVRNKGP